MKGGFFSIKNLRAASREEVRAEVERGRQIQKKREAKGLTTAPKPSPWISEKWNSSPSEQAGLLGWEETLNTATATTAMNPQLFNGDDISLDKIKKTLEDYGDGGGIKFRSKIAISREEYEALQRMTLRSEFPTPPHSFLEPGVGLVITENKRRRRGDAPLVHPKKELQETWGRQSLPEPSPIPDPLADGVSITRTGGDFLVQGEDGRTIASLTLEGALALAKERGWPQDFDL